MNIRQQRISPNLSLSLFHSPVSLFCRGSPVPDRRGDSTPHQPVEDSRAVTAHGCVAVKGDQHITLSAELTYKTLGLAPLWGGRKSRSGGWAPQGHMASPPLRLRAELPGLLWGAHLTVQLMCLANSMRVCERAAQVARVCVQQVLDGVHLIVLHKVLPILELWNPTACSPPTAQPPSRPPWEQH